MYLLGFFCRADSSYRTHYITMYDSWYYYINHEWLWNECYVYLNYYYSGRFYLFYLHGMYEIARFILCGHDALMALDFQINLFVIVQKKNYPLFSLQVFSNGNISSTSKSNN